MAPKRPQSTFPKKRSAQRQCLNEPETADEFLQAGVELEEAGEKWRAGDSVKSLRFFRKAIDKYGIGAKLFPNSLDLAYNKARLEYDITQQPAFTAQLGSSYISLLKVAAASHRVALNIEQENADVLFNFAQVCSSLAETNHDAVIEDRSPDESPPELLQRALSFLERCFRIQEAQFSQLQQGFEERQRDESDIERDPRSGGLDTSEMIEEETWAAIVEPISAESLLDTSLAQLDMLKLLCSFQFVNIANNLEMIEKIYTSELKNRVNVWSQKAESAREAVMGNIGFLCAFAIARFRLGYTAVSGFEDEFNSSIAMSETLVDLNNDAEALCMVADSHIDFNTSLEDRLLNTNPSISNDEMQLFGRIRWKHITAALDNYSTASRIPGVKNLVRIHVSRGDCELLRTRLGEPPLNYGVSSKSEPTLIGNAYVYYNAARKALSLQENLGNLPDFAIEIEVKTAFVRTVRDSESYSLTSLVQKYGTLSLQELQGMKEERLVGDRRWAFIEALTQHVP